MASYYSKPKAPSALDKIENKVKGFVSNIGHEIKDVNRSNAKLEELQFRARNYPPNESAVHGLGREYYGQQANIARDQLDKQYGQLAGAVLQGRRYDVNGKQITATSVQQKPFTGKK
jgi:hypothetical protein